MSEITRNDIAGDEVWSLREGKLQTLLAHAARIGHNAGTYGWNWDAFSLEASNGEAVTLCVGARNLVGPAVPDAVVQEFEDKACQMAQSVDREYQAAALLRELADRLLER